MNVASNLTPSSSSEQLPGMDQDQALQSEPEFLTVKQAAKHLNLSGSCVYRLCITGKMPHYKFGNGSGAIRISRKELHAFIERCRVDERKLQGVGSRSKASDYVCQRLDFRPRHSCGVMTKAGTPCTNMTKDEFCHLHQPKQIKKAM